MVEEVEEESLAPNGEDAEVAPGRSSTAAAPRPQARCAECCIHSMLAGSSCCLFDETVAFTCCGHQPKLTAAHCPFNK